MSLSLKMMREMTELSMLTPDDSRRSLFETQLSSASEELRAGWKAVEREEEILRVTLASQFGPSVVPQNLAAQLMEIPSLVPIKQRRSWREISVPWPIAAAVILAVFGAGGYLYWLSEKPNASIAEYPAAPKEAVTRVAGLAANYHGAKAPLDVQGSNASVVLAELQAENAGRIPFGIMMPAVAPDYHLLGGSIVPFGTGAAIYTRWEHAGRIYSLYQFAPETVGMPRLFSREMEVPVTLPQPAKADYVSLWVASPDGASTWAAVRDSDAPPEPFSGCD